MILNIEEQKNKKLGKGLTSITSLCGFEKNSVKKKITLGNSTYIKVALQKKIKKRPYNLQVKGTVSVALNPKFSSESKEISPDSAFTLVFMFFNPIPFDF